MKGDKKMKYQSPYNPTAFIPEPVMVDGKKTYIFKDTSGNIIRTETVIDEETFDTTIHVQEYPIEEHHYHIEYNMLSPSKIKSKIYIKGNNALRRFDYDSKGIPNTLTLYKNNQPIKQLKYVINKIWEETITTRTGFFSKKKEKVQYQESKNGEIIRYRIIRPKEEIIFDANGNISKINKKDLIGNIIQSFDTIKYNISFDEQTRNYSITEKTTEELNQQKIEESLNSSNRRFQPQIQPKENVIDKFDDQNRIIERLYYDQNNVTYKKETYTYDENGYTKTSWHLKGAFWHKHGHEVRYDSQNKIVSAEYYNDHNLVPYTPTATEFKIYTENYEDHSFLEELKRKLSKINVLKLVDLTKEAIDQIHDYVRLNPDRFDLKTLKIVHSFPQENANLTIPFQNLESLDLSEANLINLDKVVIPDSSTELNVDLNNVKGPEIDFSQCHKIEKLTLNLSNSPTVKTFIFPPNMKELNLSIDNVMQLETIDLSAYKDLKINFSYKGNPKSISKKSYSIDFSYQNESDKLEALKKLALFAEIQNRKRNTPKVQIKLHEEHALNVIKKPEITTVKETQKEEKTVSDNLTSSSGEKSTRPSRATVSKKTPLKRSKTKSFENNTPIQRDVEIISPQTNNNTPSIETEIIPIQENNIKPVLDSDTTQVHVVRQKEALTIIQKREKIIIISPILKEIARKMQERTKM